MLAASRRRPRNSDNRGPVEEEEAVDTDDVKDVLEGIAEKRPDDNVTVPLRLKSRIFA